MNLQTGTLAERVSDFFRDSFDYVKYAAASAAGAAVIALSSGAAAQTPIPAASALAPAATSSAAPAPRRYLGAELQQKVDTFKEICANQTHMGWLTRYAVRCESVNEEHLRLRLETPVGKPDKQESRQWELYKFGDLVSSFDFMVNPETKRMFAEGIAELHNRDVRSQNPRAPVSNLLDQNLIDIVSAGANGTGGARLEAVYDLDQHKTQYGAVGAAVKSRVKQRYGFNTPVWNRQETIALDVNLLHYIDLQALRAKINREERRQTSPIEMYGVQGDIVFEQIEPATGNSIRAVAPVGGTFNLAPGVYIARSRNNKNFMPFVDFNTDGKTDLENAFEFAPGWAGTMLVRQQYTGTEKLSSDVRKSIESRQEYAIRVAALTGAMPAQGTAPPTLPAPGTPTMGTSVAPSAGTAPPLATPASVPPATPPTLLQLIDAEAAGMFARLSRHLNFVLMPGYGFFSLENTFEESGYEARSNALGPTIAGRVSSLDPFGSPVRIVLEGDYFRIKEGNGTVEKAGDELGTFIYDGSWRTVAAEAAYVRWLGDHVNEPDQYARRLNAYVGLRGEQALAEISGRNITENERTTNALLLVGQVDLANAALNGMDRAISVQLGAGVNKQSNTNGLDYDAGFSVRIAADYLARFGEIALTASAGGSYNTMSTGAHGQEQEREEISLAARLGGSYAFGDQRQHQVGLGVAHRRTSAKNIAAERQQVSETMQDTRIEIKADLAF